MLFVNVKRLVLLCEWSLVTISTPLDQSLINVASSNQMKTFSFWKGRNLIDVFVMVMEK